MIAALLALALWQDPPPPPPPPPAPAPCTVNPAAPCTSFAMVIEGWAPRAITAEDLGGRDPATIPEGAVCLGRLSIGRLRYFTDGTAPSALVGTIAPVPAGAEPQAATDPHGTLEESGEAILLYNRDLILGFKATPADWSLAELSWECTL